MQESRCACLLRVWVATWSACQALVLSTCRWVTHTHTLTLTHIGVDKHFHRRVHRQKMLTSFYRSILMPGVLAVNVAVCAMSAFCLLIMRLYLFYLRLFTVSVSALACLHNVGKVRNCHGLGLGGQCLHSPNFDASALFCMRSRTHTFTLFSTCSPAPHLCSLSHSCTYIGCSLGGTSAVPNQRQHHGLHTQIHSRTEDPTPKP